jgi:hypothetical protein
MAFYGCGVRAYVTAPTRILVAVALANAPGDALEAEVAIQGLERQIVKALRSGGKSNAISLDILRLSPLPVL